MSHRPYSTDDLEPARRRSRHHRHRKKLVLLLLILGWLLPILGLLQAAASLLFNAYARTRLLKLSAWYAGTGVVLLLLRGLILLLKGRSRHYQPKLEEPDPDTARSGSVLIMVLILLGLMAGLVLNLQISSRTTLRREEAAHLKMRLLTAAGDAARQALQDLAQDANLLVDDLQEKWAEPYEEMDPTGIALHVRITDENRFFDFNNLSIPADTQTVRTPEDAALELMTLCGDFAPVDRVNALMDWIDTDAGGAYEERYYLALDPPYRTANRILYSWGDLLHIKGFDEAYLKRHDRSSPMDAFQSDIMDCFTIIPTPRTLPTPININTASKDVLLGVLGIQHEDMVRTILGMRSLTPLRSVDTLLAALGPEVLNALRPYIAVNSTVFRIEVRAYAEGSAENLRVLARRSKEGQVDIIQWSY